MFSAYSSLEYIGGCQMTWDPHFLAEHISIRLKISLILQIPYLKQGEYDV